MVLRRQMGFQTLSAYVLRLEAIERAQRVFRQLVAAVVDVCELGDAAAESFDVVNYQATAARRENDGSSSSAAKTGSDTERLLETDRTAAPLSTKRDLSSSRLHETDGTVVATHNDGDDKIEILPTDAILQLMERWSVTQPKIITEVRARNQLERERKVYFETRFPNLLHLSFQIHLCILELLNLFSCTFKRALVK